MIGTAVPAGGSLEKPSDGFALVPIQTHWSPSIELSAEELARELALRLTEARRNLQYSLRDLQSRAGAKIRDSEQGCSTRALCVARHDEARDADWPMFDPDLSEFLTPCDLVIAACPVHMV